MSKNKLYNIISIACFFGFAYLFYTLNYSESTSLSFCMIKNVTGFPCPSCGTTRAIHLLLEEKFVASLLMNPFGILLAILMAIVPFWIVFDIGTKKETFFINYKKAEAIIRTKKLAIFLIILVILNWIWNIYKEL